MRDLPTIAFFRVVALLRRHGPLPGILAARRPGAIMDKSGPPRLITSHALTQQEFPLKKDPKNVTLKPKKCYRCVDPNVLPMSILFHHNGGRLTVDGRL